MAHEEGEAGAGPAYTTAQLDGLLLDRARLIDPARSTFTEDECRAMMGNVYTTNAYHGSDAHLTLLGAPWHFNLLTGQDKADMLAFGRACMEAEIERCARSVEALRDSHCRGTGGECKAADESCNFVAAWNDAVLAIRGA